MLPLTPDKKQIPEARMGISPSPDRFEKSPRLQMPVAFSGLPTGAMGYFKQFFDAYHLSPIQGAGGGSPVESAPIEPGQIVGLEFVRGAFTAFGYGTMTYIEGDQLLGFGHSMFGEGNVNLRSPAVMSTSFYRVYRDRPRWLLRRNRLAHSCKTVRRRLLA